MMYDSAWHHIPEAFVCCFRGFTLWPLFAATFMLTRMEAVDVISLQSVITETQCRNKSRLGSEPPFYSNRYNHK